MNPLAKIAAVALSAAAFATVAYAKGPAHQEIATALQHAEFSAQSQQLSGIHLHLHHVVNCLVGEHGKQFYAAAGNPCHGMGNGAINDAAGNAALRAKLEKILATAEKGLAENDPKTARETALRVKGMLQKVLAPNKGRT